MTSNTWGLRLAANFIVIACFVGFLYVIQAVAPEIEASLFPVLSDQKPTVERVPGGVRFWLTLRKNRACQIERIAWFIVDEGGGISARAPITVRNLTTNEEVRPLGGAYPPGYMRNGWFEALIPESFSGADLIIGYIDYRCHPFWTTPQIYGPFPIPQVKP